MADPALTRATRHYVIDQSTSTQAVLPLHEYIGGHETVMATQASEITVEQSSTIESYAEGLDLTHTARPMYAGAEVDKLIALEDNHDTTWLAVIYDDGSFYLGKTSVGTSGEYPTTGFVTQNTDFGQVEPWLGFYKGAARFSGNLAANTASSFAAIGKQFDKAPKQAYLLMVTPTGIASNAKITIEDGGTAVSKALACNTVGLYKFELASSKQSYEGADSFKIDKAATGGTAEFYILIGFELST